MNLLKNIFIGIFFLYAMYWGGVGTQSSGTFAQGLGFVSIVMALGSLYVLYRLIPKVLSSTTTVLIIIAICAYSAYCLGFFNDKSISGFLTGQTSEDADDTDDEYEPTIAEEGDEVDDVAQEMFDEQQNATEQQKESKGLELNKIKSKPVHRKKRVTHSPAPAVENKGVIGKLRTWLLGDESKTSAQPSIADINPYDYPSITGYARVISGSIIKVEGVYIKLFGIAAPNIQQTCSNKHGAGYYCGREAAIWLQNWLNNRVVTCYILGQIVRGRATGACFVENNKYDVAAAVINAGWAVAYTRNTQIYVPYEQQAAQNRKGLWQGEFYKPWDWEKIQNRKVDIEIHVPEPQSSSSSSSSKGWGFNMNMFKGLF